MIRVFLGVFFLLGCVIDPARQPNFGLVMTDDHGYGDDRENPAQLTGMNLHGPTTDDIPWNQTHFNKAKWVNVHWMVVHWMVEFAPSGRYEFTLRQKPAAAQFPIDATMTAITVGNQEAHSS
ncbi:MAG: hypothetical protein ACI9OD_005201 [Limisphaerales bacterium]|jgi:hypothetical protein